MSPSSLLSGQSVHSPVRERCCIFGTTGKSLRLSSSPSLKNILLFSIADLWHIRSVLPGKGAARDRHEPCGGMRWTRRHTLTSGARSGRRSRVVLTPRPWRQVGASYRAADGGKQRRSPGRARISRKTIARGKPGCLGCTCQIRVRPSLPLHTVLRAQSAPGFPCALCGSEGQRDCRTRADRVAGTTAYVSPSLRGAKRRPVYACCASYAGLGVRRSSKSQGGNNPPIRPWRHGLLRGACHPAALRADGVARLGPYFTPVRIGLSFNPLLS